MSGYGYVKESNYNALAKELAAEQSRRKSVDRERDEVWPEVIRASDALIESNRLISELAAQLEESAAGNIRPVHDREDAMFALARIREAVEREPCSVSCDSRSPLCGICRKPMRGDDSCLTGGSRTVQSIPRPCNCFKSRVLVALPVSGLADAVQAVVEAYTESGLLPRSMPITEWPLEDALNALVAAWLIPRK